MKLSFFTTSTFASFVMLLFSSCTTPNSKPEPEKEVTTSESTKFNLSKRDDLLVFKRIEDYENIVNQQSDSVNLEFMRAVKSLKFESLLDNYHKSKIKNPFIIDSLIRDDFFESIINKELSIQIGDNIFRINPKKRKVFVLPVLNIKEYNDLVAENISNKNIKVFSTDDEVLDLIKNKSESNDSNGMAKCNEGGIGSKYHGVYIENGLYTASAAYLKYGIYFSLNAVVTPVGSSGWGYDFDFNGGYPNSGRVKYKLKCSTTADYGIRTPGTWDWLNGQRKYQSWKGTRFLSKLYFAFVIRNNATNSVVSPLIIIRQNY